MLLHKKILAVGPQDEVEQQGQRDAPGQQGHRGGSHVKLQVGHMLCYRDPAEAKMTTDRVTSD